MNATALAAPLLALAVFAPTASSPAPEPIELAWRLAEGEQFLVTTDMAMETTTTTMGEPQVQSTENRSTRLVVVEEVDDAGNMHLAISVQAFAMVQGSEDMDLDLTAERDEDGDVVVSAVIDSDNPMLNDGEMQRFFEAFGENLLELTFEMVVTPQGKVLKATVDRDPFVGLPDDSPVLAMTLKALEVMISAEDLPEIAAGEMFLQLSPEPVEPGDDWTVVRAMNVAGFGLSGSGSTRFESLERDGETAVALLVESTDYEIETDGMSEKLDELMRAIFESMELEMETSTDLQGDDFSVESRIEFDVAGGFARQVVWEGQTIEVSGTMEVGDQSMEMEIVTEVSRSSASWERVEADEED